MATRRSSTGSGTRGGGTARQSKATSRKKAAPAPAAVEVEVVEEAGGPGIETGAAVMTFIVLVVAILFVDHHLATEYGEGVFF